MVLLQVLESCSRDVGWAAPPEGSTGAGGLASKKAHVPLCGPPHGLP